MSKLKKQFISNIPYYVLFFILLFIHIQLNVSTGDDVNFAIRAKSMTLQILIYINTIIGLLGN